jgi:lipopolysaccharide export system permease protein
MKILFITGGSIGDAVISTGLLAHLLDTYPTARFTVAAGPAATPLFEAMPRLDRIIVIRKKKGNMHWWALWRAVRHERWDLVIDLRGSALSFLLHAKKRKIFQRADKSKTKLDQLAALLNLSPSPAPRLWVSDESMQKAKALLPSGPVIVMVPKSNSAYKDWPMERFAELALRLLKKPKLAGATIVILGVAEQTPFFVPLVQALPPAQVLDLSGKTDMPTACAILKQAALVIGNDSGLLHMTGALGARLVGLYGPTNDKKYAPRGAHVRIAKVRDFADDEGEIHDASIIKRLSVDQVEAAVDDLLSSAATSSAP